MDARPDRRSSTTCERTLTCVVDSVRARFGACRDVSAFGHQRSDAQRSFRGGSAAGGHRGDGFDVVYLPPVHPIGETHRKGRNNTLTASRRPRQPWAIGAARPYRHRAGPGTLDDFDRFVGWQIASGWTSLDIAFQASPDHPWVREHPGVPASAGRIDHARRTRRRNTRTSIRSISNRPNGSRCGALRASSASGSATVFASSGRQPATKPFRFWKWVIADIRRDYGRDLPVGGVHPPEGDAIPREAGFSPLFTWRNSAQELRDT